MSCTKPGLVWDNILSRFRQLWFTKQTCFDNKNMSPFWFSVLASQPTIISGATTILFLLKELCGTQWCLVGCVCLNLWKYSICPFSSVVWCKYKCVISNIKMLISPVYSSTHPFLFLSPIFLILLPILSFILSFLFSPYFKVLKTKNCSK